MRLIDADILKEEFYNRKRTPDDMKYMRVPVEVVYQFIDNAPTVEMPNWYKVYEDVKSTFERPKGEWIQTSNFDEFYGKVYKCTNCNEETLGCSCHNYCPNCGAKMKGGAEE